MHAPASLSLPPVISALPLCSHPDHRATKGKRRDARRLPSPAPLAHGEIERQWPEPPRYGPCGRQADTPGVMPMSQQPVHSIFKSCFCGAAREGAASLTIRAVVAVAAVTRQGLRHRNFVQLSEVTMQTRRPDDLALKARN